MRPARAIAQTGERAPRLQASVTPALPPTVRGRRRDAEGGRGRLHTPIPPSIACTSAKRPDSPSLALRCSLIRGLLPAVVIADAQPRRRPGWIPQTFTTCVGTSASYRPSEYLAMLAPFFGSVRSW